MQIQLLEEISAQETTELQDLIKELETELPKITDASLKQQIEAALNQYKEYKANATQGVDDEVTAVLDKLIQTVTVLLRQLLKIPLWIQMKCPKN